MNSHLSRDDPAAVAQGETDNPLLRLHAYQREALRPIEHPVAFLLWALNNIWGE
jgi:hypothetical protein